MPADNALNTNNQHQTTSIENNQSMGIGLASAERPGGAIRDRADLSGTYSASREGGKRLNMLGFNNAGQQMILGEGANSSTNAMVAGAAG